MRRLSRMFFAALLAALAAMVIQSAPLRAEEQPDKKIVITATISGTVIEDTEAFVSRVIRHAEQVGAALVVFRVDTSSGLTAPTTGIVRAISNSSVPVAAWVPPGCSAMSAGSNIVQAAHVAAAAQGVNIDVDVSVLADGFTSLLQILNGREVMVKGQRTVIEIPADASVTNLEMNVIERIMLSLAVPEIVFLLLLGGLLCVLIEVIAPGGMIMGMIGAVMLSLGVIGLKALSFSWVGIVLLVAGVLVMSLDAVTGKTGGLLVLIGTAATGGGGMLLFDVPGNELLSVSVGSIAGIAAAMGLCFAFFARLLLRSVRAQVTTGQEGLVGVEVEITEDLNPEGMVKCRGEVWKARTAGETLPAGDTAVITSIDGITLIVKAK